MSPTLRQFAPSDRQSPLIRVALVARKGGGGGGRGGGGGGARASSGGKASSSSSVANSGRSASTFSKGGGKPSTVSSGAFAGRQIGGGTRDQVYGTSQYGSGYPYGVASEASVAGRPFPFGFWPLYVSPGLYNSDEYGPANNASRPGGLMSTALVTSPSALETYHIIGDQESVFGVMAALQSSCAVSASSVAPYDLSAPNSTLPGAAQMVQYYRASSFALALDSYNNTSSDPSTPSPLPTSLNRTFLLCLNTTIAAAVPILDGPHGLTKVQIAWIVLGSIEAFLIILVIISCCCSRPKDRLAATPKPRPTQPIVVSSPMPLKPWLSGSTIVASSSQEFVIHQAEKKPQYEQQPHISK